MCCSRQGRVYIGVVEDLIGGLHQGQDCVTGESRVETHTARSTRFPAAPQRYCQRPQCFHSRDGRSCSIAWPFRDGSLKRLGGDVAPLDPMLTRMSASDSARACGQSPASISGSWTPSRSANPVPRADIRGGRGESSTERSSRRTGPWRCRGTAPARAIRPSTRARAGTAAAAPARSEGSCAPTAAGSPTRTGYPTVDYHEEALRAKVNSKMTVATFLAGFVFTALSALLLLDKHEWPWHRGDRGNDTHRVAGSVRRLGLHLRPAGHAVGILDRRR